MDNLFGSQQFEYHKAAVISSCERYRYKLVRKWEEEDRPLVFVMLNPSTADASVDDPTIRKCVGFAKLNGFTGIEVYNLFAVRSTDPKALLSYDETGRNGADNDQWLRSIDPRHQVVAAWGKFAYPHNWGFRRIREVSTLLNRSLYCVKQTGGEPWHPLYVKYGQLEILA